MRRLALAQLGAGVIALVVVLFDVLGGSPLPQKPVLVSAWAFALAGISIANGVRSPRRTATWLIWLMVAWALFASTVSWALWSS
jgi:hypothetical protein